MESKHYPKAKVSILDEMDVIGEVFIGEDGDVRIIQERTGKEVTSHIRNCVVKEL